MISDEMHEQSAQQPSAAGGNGWLCRAAGGNGQFRAGAAVNAAGAAALPSCIPTAEGNASCTLLLEPEQGGDLH